jgi:hypothetical protein
VQDARALVGVAHACHRRDLRVPAGHDREVRRTAGRDRPERALGVLEGEVLGCGRRRELAGERVRRDDREGVGEAKNGVVRRRSVLRQESDDPRFDLGTDGCLFVRQFRS